MTEIENGAQAPFPPQEEFVRDRVGDFLQKIVDAAQTTHGLALAYSNDL